MTDSTGDPIDVDRRREGASRVKPAGRRNGVPFPVFVDRPSVHRNAY